MCQPAAAAARPPAWRAQAWPLAASVATVCFLLRHPLLLCSFALHTATQIASLLAWSTLPASERAQRVGSIAVQLAFLLLPWLVPAFYLRWRRPILIVERIQFFMWPLLRQPKGKADSLWSPGRAGRADGCPTPPPCQHTIMCTCPCWDAPWMATIGPHCTICRHPEQPQPRTEIRTAGRAARPAALHLGALMHLGAQPSGPACDSRYMVPNGSCGSSALTC